MNKRFVSVVATLLCVMLCAFGLAACGEDNSGDNGKTQTVAVASVTLNKTELTLTVGGEETLTATVTPDNATNKTVAWSSDNTAVATVADGKVTAVAAGTATITATADGKKATCSVTVNAPAPDTSVAGKTFVIADMTCDGMDDETLQAMKGMNEGSTIAFSDDGNVTSTTPKMFVVSTGTYTQNGEKIIITIKEVTMNGESASGEEYAVECTYDGNEFIMASLVGEDIVVYSTFILQTAE